MSLCGDLTCISWEWIKWRNILHNNYSWGYVLSCVVLTTSNVLEFFKSSNKDKWLNTAFTVKPGFDQSKGNTLPSIAYLPLFFVTMEDLMNYDSDQTTV